MTPAERRSRLVGIATVALAACVWSFGGLYMRALALDVWTIQFWRAAFAAAALFLWTAFADPAAYRGFADRRLGATLAAAAVSALSMAAYIHAMDRTSIADVMIVFATCPLIAGAIGWAAGGGRPSRRATVASLVALAGIVVMVHGAAGGHSLAGIGLAFVMTITFALLIVMAQRRPDVSSPLLNAVAAVFVCIAVAPLASYAIPLRDMLILAAFGVTTSALAFALFLVGARRLPPAEASLIGLLDSVLGPVWVWLFFAERPADATLIGGAIVFAALIWLLAGEARMQRVPPAGA